jgi:hypothetical protein
MAFSPQVNYTDRTTWIQIECVNTTTFLVNYYDISFTYIMRSEVKCGMNNELDEKQL